jgi:hypothetical protein
MTRLSNLIRRETTLGFQVWVIGQARHRAPPFLPSIGVNISVGQTFPL